MKKKTTRTLVILLALIMLLPLVPAGAQQAKPLVIASTTAMSGEFFAGMWGNNTTDMDIRLLLHDYPTIVWDLDEKATMNERAVRSLDRSLDAEGNTVISFTLKDGLRFSNGSAITARDYVFTLLLESSPLIPALGGTNASRDHLVGAQAYASGASSVFSGVRLLSNQRFSLTIDKSYLPYYYDLAFAQVQPYPAAVIAPGIQVKDDGGGAYLKGELTKELLERSILDPATGYLSHPKVVSGAYKLTAYDAQAKTAELTINPYYLGNREGQKPTINRLLVRAINNADIASALEKGEVQLVNKISAADSIDAVRALPQDSVMSQAYPRNGLAYLTFSAEREPASSPLLRQAIARMVDREQITRDFLRGYGQPVYGYYGLGQWMPRTLGAGLSAFNKHPYDLSAAQRLLEEDGWTLNSDGTAYQPEAGGLRHKQLGDQLKQLTLKLGLTENNQAAELVAKSLQASLAQLGGQMEVSYLSMRDLLRQHYRQDERAYDMLFLASNFGYVFDPYHSYQTGDAYQGILNTSGLRDETLLVLAQALRETMPGDKAAYLTNWTAFQHHWAEVLPLLPLYSNTYYDGFSAKLTDYQPARYYSWAEAILYAKYK